MRLFAPLLLALYLLSGCAQPAKEIALIEPAPMPQWALTPPPNDAQWLYGSGTGRTTQEATRAALADLASRVSVTIASSLQTQTTLHEAGSTRYQKTSTHQIRSEVALLSFRHHEVHAATQLGADHFVVLVRSDRHLFVRTLKAEIQTLFADLMREERDTNPIERYRLLQARHTQARQSQEKLWVLSGLDLDFDATPYEQKITHLHDRQNEARQAITFTLSANDPYSAKMAEAIEAGLGRAGFVVYPPQEASLEIRLQTELHPSNTSGLKIADITLHLQTHKPAKGAIATASHHFKTGAARGQAVALQMAANDLNTQIQNDGIFAVLGFKP